MNVWLRWPLSALSLLALWLLLVGSVAPGDVLLGLLLASLITAATARFWPARPRVRRPWLLVLYLYRLGLDIVTANFSVAALVLNPRRRVRPLFVELPLTIEDPFAVYLFASTVSLTPGTVSADLRPGGEQGRQVLLVHIMDAEDGPHQAEALCRDLKRRYEAPLMEMFR